MQSLADLLFCIQTNRERELIHIWSATMSHWKWNGRGMNKNETKKQNNQNKNREIIALSFDIEVLMDLNPERRKFCNYILWFSMLFIQPMENGEDDVIGQRM